MQKQIELPIYGSFEVLSTDESDESDGNAGTTMGCGEREKLAVCASSRGETFRVQGTYLATVWVWGPPFASFALSRSLYIYAARAREQKRSLISGGQPSVDMLSLQVLATSRPPLPLFIGQKNNE